MKFYDLKKDPDEMVMKLIIRNTWKLSANIIKTGHTYE